MPTPRRTDIVGARTDSRPFKLMNTETDLTCLTKLLGCYPVISQLSPDGQGRLTQQARWMRVPAGAMLFDDRQACEGFPFVVEGTVRVSKCAPSGRELPLYRVGPGETCIISSSCLLGHEDYNARGITESDTLLMLLPKPVFDEMMGERPFRDFVFHLFAERIADLMQLIEEVAFRKLDQRLATLLLGKGRLLHTTHQQLADELGSVREIVSRLLKSFADQGLVRLGREQVEILDPAGLRKLSSEGSGKA
jgi:CRP/FNR family transcriptional regulator